MNLYDEDLKIVREKMARGEVPTHEELMNAYVSPMPPQVSIDIVIRARWMSQRLAPNGVDELAGWLLILCQMVRDLKKESEGSNAE